MAKILKATPRADGRDVLDMARERMDYLYRQHDHVAVGFSGGKDSTVVLNLAIEAAERAGRLPVDVVHYDEEAIPYETEEYVRRVGQDPRVKLRWYCLPVMHRNACSPKSPFWYPWLEEDREKWCRPMPPEAHPWPEGFRPKVDRIHEMNHLILTPDLGVSCMVLGLRAQESLMRARAVLMRKGQDHFVTSVGRGISTASPIFDWKTDDVWRAPRVLGWDYNRAYDRMEDAGLHPNLQRCAPPYGEEPIGGLWVFKVAFPELWQKMCVRVPGAATAARYARTELYGFGGFPPKPPDATWEEHIKHFVMKYEGEDRRVVAQNVAGQIKAHYSKTNDPILTAVAHPLTGVSWSYLFKVAMRGNFKGRLNPPVNPNNFEAQNARYQAARAQEQQP